MRKLAVIAVALVAGACSSSHTTSTTSRGTSGLDSSTTTTVCRARQPVEIFFKMNAAPLQILAVRAQLQHDRSVTGVHFLDHNAAYANAKKLFRDDPGVLFAVKPRDLPESFRATTRRGTDPHELATRYAALAGVTSVNFPRTVRLRCG